MKRSMGRNVIFCLLVSLVTLVWAGYGCHASLHSDASNSKTGQEVSTEVGAVNQKTGQHEAESTKPRKERTRAPKYRNRVGYNR